MPLGAMTSERVDQGLERARGGSAADRASEDIARSTSNGSITPMRFANTGSIGSHALFSENVRNVPETLPVYPRKRIVSRAHRRTF